MVNTRHNQCNGQPSNNNNNNNNTNNANLEQLLNTQNQLMQAMLQTLNNMQPNQQQAPPPPHQSRLAEFLRTRPITFSQAKDPMDAEDWLKGVEKKIVFAQCTDR
jgi:hypothetical protein